MHDTSVITSKGDLKRRRPRIDMNVKFGKGTLSRLRHTFKDCEKSMSDMEKL